MHGFVIDKLDSKDEDENNIIKLLAMRNEILQKEDNRNSTRYIQWCCNLQDKTAPISKRKPEVSAKIRTGGEYLKVKLRRRRSSKTSIDS